LHDTIAARGATEKGRSGEKIEFSTGVKYVQKIDNGEFVDLPFDLTLKLFFLSPSAHACSPHKAFLLPALPAPFVSAVFEETREKCGATQIGERRKKFQSNCNTIRF
jgi:hypothetical protein